jgi:hypothetical protein
MNERSINFLAALLAHIPDPDAALEAASDGADSNEAATAGAVAGGSANFSSALHAQQQRGSSPKTVAVTINVVADLGFSEALALLKQDERVTRHAWRDASQYVTLEGPKPIYGYDRPFLLMTEPNGFKAPWVPAPQDLLADDWAHIPGGN